MRHLIAVKLTISQRLWLGLGVILLLFGAADLVSFRASHQLDSALGGLVDRGGQRNDAAFAMGAQLEEMSRAAQQYMGRHQPRQRERFMAAREAFEEALRRYRALASTDNSRALSEQTTWLYAQLRLKLDETLQLEERQAERIATYRSHRQLAKASIDAMPNSVDAGRGAETSYQHAPANEVAAHVFSRAKGAELDLRARSADLVARLKGERQALERAIERYRKVAFLPHERKWAAQVDRWFTEDTDMALAIVTAEGIQRQRWDEVVALRDVLAQLLRHSIQPAARAELAAAVERASATSHEAHGLITRGLLLALGLAVLVALATSRAVHAPLRALVSSSRRVAEGDFAYRVPVTSSDALGELTAAFNEMARKLQATTVSRSYMESIVNSMGEALLVSRDGVIETANPAAERLLGYESGGLVGTPAATIAPEGLDASGGPEAPSRAIAELRTRDGDLVPAALTAVQAPSTGGDSPSTVCVAQDLRERLAAEQHQRQAAVVFENTQEGIVLANAQRQVVLVNPAVTEVTGYAPDEMLGRPVGVLWAGGDADAAAVWEQVGQCGEWHGEVRVGCKDGGQRPVWMNINIVRDDAGRIANYVCVFSDIAAIKAAEAQLNHLAHHDVLTGLPNRLLLAERVATALRDAQRTGRSVALLFLDLDDFKHVNDTLGHYEGDRLLRMVAGRLRDSLDGNECIARLGGDEFVIVLEQIADFEEAALVARRVLGAFNAPLELGGLELRMRASIGISLGPQHGVTGEELLKAADAAMYRAKNGGRGTYEFFSAELTRQALERLTLQNALRHPSLNEQLVLEFQPQVCLTTGRLVGVEALVRWQHPTLGRISPMVFIPLAEEIGLIRNIGDWVLQTACAQAAAWRNAGILGLRMAVNVSAHQIRSDALVKSVTTVLQQTGLEPSLLELEVTEGALQTGAGATDVLGRLKRVGVKLALDDFGTGYSALSSLKLLPFDRLKIDRSFVRDLHDDANDQALARAVIAMGRSLGLEVIAEGVESEAQLAFLRDEGCDEMQGYLFGAPMSASELEQRIREGAYRLSEPAAVHAFPDRSLRRTRALRKARRTV